ncbi:MAG: helicase-exonuclease AddAB subunit AddA [Lachnospiraceae bacterium]|jgi:ATP-dependent helicase/nuclease subunit A|nr:helicase-exonuclease AddAB subunit AddA [Lachnospiraceae bacterium]
MGVTWTDEQKQVIHERGHNLLVSAAAGSGKTAVLVERILSLITDPENPADIDRLLVVTFTNAAAQEMKERISAAIGARLAEHPDDVHLQRQMVLLPGARISTIDGFCTYVIQNYFHTIDLDPGFRIAEEGELKLMKADVLGELLEEHYAADDPEFVRFVESFSRGKNDSGLEDLIDRVYRFAATSPDPSGWLAGCLDDYRAETEEELAGSFWMQDMMKRAVFLAGDIRRMAEEAVRVAKSPGGPAPSLPILEADLASAEALASCRTYGEFYSCVGEIKFRTLNQNGKKYADTDPEKKDRVRTIREGVKDAVKKLRMKYFPVPPDRILSELAQIRPLAEELAALTEEFSDRYAQKKRESGVVDFNDLEHFALRILLKKTENGWERTDAAQELQKRFQAVMCDEYQDSNLLQELILDAVSGADQNRYDRFMVGDMKQSIYAFRMARPDLFMEKYREYAPLPKEPEQFPEDAAGVRITLGKNFRSRREVLGPVNAIFRKLMCGTPGGIVYDDDAALVEGASYPQNGDADRAELILIDRKAEAFRESGSGDAVIEAEAMAAAARIRDLAEHGRVFDRDSGGMRKASYGDIAVLLRDGKKSAPVYERVLTGAGIPAVTASGSGYFSAVEVETVLNYLRILDNPMQEIPLTAVMRSPIGGFTDRELAVIRSIDQDVPYYEALKKASEEGIPKSAEGAAELNEKIRNFTGMYRKLRNSVMYTPVHELIVNLLRETGYGAYAAAMPAGAQREANLKMLAEKAVEFGKTSYHGLFQFVRYIEKLKKYEVDYGEANPESGGGDSVRIMTIHKSKGLEFPFVLLGGLGSKFNTNDSRSEVVLHVTAGIGIDAIDPEARTKTSSAIRRAVAGTISDDALGEEMRVLYVAMTRAKEKLIMIGSLDLDDPVRAAIGNAGRSEEPLSYEVRSSASCYLDWIIPALPDETLIHVTVADPSGIGGGEISRTESERARLRRLMRAADTVRGGAAADPDVRAFLQARRDFCYPYGETAELPAKLSVSELKTRRTGEEQEEAGEELYPEETMVPLIPGFMQEKESEEERSAAFSGGGGAVRGTAYHRVFRALDLNRAGTAEEVRLQIASMVSRGLLAPEEAEAVRAEDIAVFSASGLAERMRRADARGELRREQPFVADIPAREIDPSYDSDEPILIQGVIDAYFKEDGKYVIVDYKTDRVGRGGAGVLKKRYRAQLLYYRKAVEQILRVPVGEMILYSTGLGREVPVR